MNKWVIGPSLKTGTDTRTEELRAYTCCIHTKQVVLPHRYDPRVEGPRTFFSQQAVCLEPVPRLQTSLGVAPGTTLLEGTVLTSPHQVGDACPGTAHALVSGRVGGF